MLTEEEHAKLIELQRKADQYEPLDESEIVELELRSASIIEGSLSTYPPFIEAINDFNRLLRNLAKDNMRLILERRYWYEIANKELAD